MTDTQSMLRVGTLIHRSGKLYVIHYVMLQQHSTNSFLIVTI